MKILAIRNFCINNNTHNEVSEMIGQLDLGLASEYNGGLNGVLGVRQYEAEDFYFMELGSENKVLDFFYALDNILGMPDEMGYLNAFKNAKSWTAEFLSCVKVGLNLGAGTIFFDNGNLNQLPNNLEMKEFILMYLKISQALNFADDGLIQFTNEENIYSYEV